MRTTLDIDDDVLVAAKERARLENKTAGEVISDLARQALTAPAMARGGLREADTAFDHCDWPSFPARGGLVVTNDQIRRIEHELDIEDAGLTPASSSVHRLKRAPRKSK